MLHRIPYKIASVTALVLVSLVLAFHLLILTNVIPYSIVWGGRMKNMQEMYVFEAVSMVVNVFLGIILLMHAGHLPFQFPSKVLRFILWLFVALFTLNTLGNLASKSSIETVVFTPLTIVLAILCVRIASERRHNN